jgi:hypothetical protein
MIHIPFHTVVFCFVRHFGAAAGLMLRSPAGMPSPVRAAVGIVLFHRAFLPGSEWGKTEAAQVNLCRLVHEPLSLHGFKHRKSTLLRSQ